MTEPRVPAEPSSGLAAAGSSAGVVSSSVRSRTRRPVGADQRQDDDRLDRRRADSGRVVGPSSAARPDASPARPDSGPASVAQFLGESWSQGWSSVQEFTNMFLSAGDDNPPDGTSALQSRSLQSRSRSRGPGRSFPRAREHSTGSLSKNSSAWGPSPPLRRSRLDQVAAGSVAERQAALKAARTASVLESHDGVNGGLDVTGRHKRRNSGEDASANQQPDDCLVYIHHIQPNDTYAGLILRYKCREDAFRRANGLWSRDSIQTRKWLAIPVDACEIRGRPCEPPSWQRTQQPDLLASTPEAHDESLAGQGDFFKSRDDAATPESMQVCAEGEPWTHVRWVQMDAFPQPVQIGRVSRQTLGYFPPRRKKSIRTVSSLSTPRQSSEIYTQPPGSVAQCSPRRQSPLRGRPHAPGTPASHGCVESDADDSRPAWMRRPGGVGSMGGNVRAPGPDGDYFNSWTRKHLPGLNIEGLPSMSIMGSDVARFGFASETSGIVESPFEDGRSASPASRQGSGLDRAAAAVEGWLRGALAKRPSTPRIAGRTRPTGLPAGQHDSDLIELTDTGSEDGRLPTNDVSLLSLDPFSEASGRSGGEGQASRRPAMTRLGSTQGRQKDD